MDVDDDFAAELEHALGASSAQPSNVDRGGEYLSERGLRIRWEKPLLFFDPNQWIKSGEQSTAMGGLREVLIEAIARDGVRIRIRAAGKTRKARMNEIRAFGIHDLKKPFPDHVLFSVEDVAKLPAFGLPPHEAKRKADLAAQNRRKAQQQQQEDSGTREAEAKRRAAATDSWNRAKEAGRSFGDWTKNNPHGSKSALYRLIPKSER